MALSFRTIMEDSRSISLISRYESRLLRQHDRAYRILRELQKAGPPVSNPPAGPAEPAEPPQPAAESAPSQPEVKNDQTKGDDRFWPPPEMKIGEEYNPMQDWRGRL